MSSPGDEETTPRSPARGTFGCVVDAHPRFHLEALRWFATLHRVAGVDPTDLVVHEVGQGEPGVLNYLKSQGVSVVKVPPFDSRSPHCNKISGALSLARRGVDGVAVLTDTDVVVLEDPRPMAPPSAVSSKIVDAANPPLRVLKPLFARAGLSLPPLVSLDWDPSSSTVAGNGNGGFYMITGDIFSAVSRAWEHWARWLLDSADIPNKWGRFTDQIAMAMALTAEGIEKVALDPRWNFPTHRLGAIPPDPGRPAVIHYHKNVDEKGLVTMTGIPVVDGQIERANQAIAETWADAFPGTPLGGWPG